MTTTPEVGTRVQAIRSGTFGVITCANEWDGDGSFIWTVKWEMRCPECGWNDNCRTSYWSLDSALKDWKVAR